MNPDKHQAMRDHPKRRESDHHAKAAAHHHSRHYPAYEWHMDKFMAAVDKRERFEEQQRSEL